MSGSFQRIATVFSVGGALLAFGAFAWSLATFSTPLGPDAGPPPPDLPTGPRAERTAPARPYALADGYSIRSDAFLAQDLRVGDGDTARTGDVVVVDWTGWHGAGTRFHSTLENEPATFVLGDSRVAPGLDAGIVGMKPGGIRQLAIKRGHGGQRTSPPFVPRDSPMTVAVELIEVRR